MFPTCTSVRAIGHLCSPVDRRSDSFIRVVVAGFWLERRRQVVPVAGVLDSQPSPRRAMSVFERVESNVRSYCRSWPAVFTTAKGSVIHDDAGREYIDF